MITYFASLKDHIIAIVYFSIKGRFFLLCSSKKKKFAPLEAILF